MCHRCGGTTVIGGEVRLGYRMDIISVVQREQW